MTAPAGTSRALNEEFGGRRSANALRRPPNLKFMHVTIDYTAGVRQRAGIGRYTRGLVRALGAADRITDYTLFVPRDGREAVAGFGPNFRVVRARLTERQLALVWHRAHAPLPVEAWTGPADLFYSPDFVLPPMRTPRRVLTVHDLSYVRVPECHYPGNLRYLNAAVPHAVAQADLVLADSDATRRDLMEVYGVPPDRVQTLYSGVEPQLHPVRDPEAQKRVRAAYRLERPFLLSVGTVEPRKNYRRLIEAVSRLPHAVELLIVGGPGWLTEDIYDAPAAFGVGDRVRFLGFVPDDDLAVLYSLAQVFVYPSLYEGFGLPVLEALACGAVVVCSNASSLPEVTGDAALAVDPRDTEALAAALCRALQDEPLRLALAARAPAQAAKFSWAESARQLRAAFQAVSKGT